MDPVLSLVLESPQKSQIASYILDQLLCQIPPMGGNPPAVAFVPRLVPQPVVGRRPAPQGEKLWQMLPRWGCVGYILLQFWAGFAVSQSDFLRLLDGEQKNVFFWAADGGVRFLLDIYAHFSGKHVTNLYKFSLRYKSKTGNSTSTLEKYREWHNSFEKNVRNSYISRISIQMCIFKDTSLTSGESNPSSLLLVISTVSRLAERFSSKVLLHPFLLPCPQHMSQSLLKPTFRLTVFDITTKIQPASAKNAGWTWPLAFMTNWSNGK